MNSMIATAAVLLATVFSTAAKADGFVCSTEQGLNVKIYNHVSPLDGTRNISRMILSDATILKGRKTIATFAAEKGNLTDSYEGPRARFTGKVDLRMTGSKRKGEYLQGTRLGEVSEILVDIDFVYERGLVEPGASYLTVVKRNGEASTEHLTCARYVKGE